MDNEANKQKPTSSRPWTPVHGRPRTSGRAGPLRCANLRTSVIDYISSGKIELVINLPEGTYREELTSDYKIRRAAMAFGVSLINNIKCALLFAQKVRKVEIWQYRQVLRDAHDGWNPDQKLTARKMSIF
ncbi:hypothetical protein PI124_g21421 [Phytophthora idaei]|nr:hypothetical protein PI125_g23087 [Phytophthora idaei]KAG3128912.1 hypothetical protein PI126_g21181 [Phytophthora idaei]KAG3233504.1 hypothetical protein PI124_g21421 [Phytophthora idaei]